VRGTRFVALIVALVVAVIGVIVFAAGAAARRSSTSSPGGGISTTSGSLPNGSGGDGGSKGDGAGKGGTAGVTPVSAAIGLRAGVASPSAAGIAKAMAVAANLTPQQLAGQRVIYSYTGFTPPASLLSLISHGEAAGVIFFGDNIGTTPADLTLFKNAVAALKRANRMPTNPVKLPLLLMTDQEGGEVRRLPGAPVLSEKMIGQAANPAAAATSAGKGAAANLSSYGLTVNLAPVLDVFRTPGDFDDQFQRSYSSNPNVVSKLGSDFITAQQAGGVAATAKHFPGLGAAGRNQDTDSEPVTLHLTANQMRTIDELPYKSAIADKVKLVMVSWALYPALDAKYPAGLSKTIVQGELRQRLGFAGVTITDALEAGALRNFGATANRSTLAARAGMDLLLCSGQTVTQGSTAMKTLAYDYQHNVLNASRFTAAAERVMALRASLGG
jgi:beta-N-acetylhexosaminidase